MEQKKTDDGVVIAASRTASIDGSAVLAARRTVSYVVLVILLLICIVPFYMLIINATRAHSQIMGGFSLLPGGSFFANFNNAIADSNMPVMRAMLNSAIVATFNVLFAVYFSALTAYGIHAYTFRGKKTAFTFILMIMMIPTQVSALGFVNLMRDIGFIDTFIPLTVPAMAAPIVFFFMIQYLKSALPLEIVEAARIDGSSEFMTFNRIVLPLMKPALAVQAIFTFVGSWNNFFMPALILNSQENHTLPILISRLRGADLASLDMGQVYMLIAFSIVPVIVVYMLLARFIVRGISLGAVK